MTKKDVALTVGGILATMVLAYIFYKRQQEQASTAASNDQGQSAMDVTNPDFADQDALYSSAFQYMYGSQLASLSTPTTSSTASTSTTTDAVDTSAATASGTGEGSQMQTVLSNFFNEYMQNNQQNNQSADLSSLMIPALTMSSGLDTSDIPVTAAQAAAGANSALSVSGVTGGAVPAPSTQAVSSTSPGTAAMSNTHFNHIVSVGAD